jgi:hypothetical protein
VFPCFASHSIMNLTVCCQVHSNEPEYDCVLCGQTEHLNCGAVGVLLFCHQMVYRVDCGEIMGDFPFLFSYSS